VQPSHVCSTTPPPSPRAAAPRQPLCTAAAAVGAIHPSHSYASQGHNQPSITCHPYLEQQHQFQPYQLLLLLLLPLLQTSNSYFLPEQNIQHHPTTFTWNSGTRPYQLLLLLI
jgi:hypothetical protein